VFVGPMGMEKFCGVNAVGFKENHSVPNGLEAR